MKKETFIELFEICAIFFYKKKKKKKRIIKFGDLKFSVLLM